MNRHVNRTENREDFLMNLLPHALIALMLAVAVLLLMAFTSLLQDMNERGEQRRLQQRTTGSLLLVDDLRMPSAAEARLLTVAGDTNGLR